MWHIGCDLSSTDSQLPVAHRALCAWLGRSLLWSHKLSGSGFEGMAHSHGASPRGRKLNCGSLLELRTSFECSRKPFPGHAKCQGKSAVESQAGKPVNMNGHSAGVRSHSDVKREDVKVQGRNQMISMIRVVLMRGAP